MINYFSIKDFFVWTLIAVVIFGINLLFAHKLAEVFDNKFKIKN
jgi:hypothetical protein